MKNWKRAPLKEADFIDNGMGFRLTHFKQWDLLNAKFGVIGNQKGIETPHWGETLHRLIVEAHEREEKVPTRLLKRLQIIHPKLRAMLVRDGID